MQVAADLVACEQGDTVDRSDLMRIGMDSIATALAVVTVAAAASVGHAVVGITIEKIDDTAKTIAVRTLDGTTEVFRFTESTTVTGPKSATTHVADLAGKDSYHFVVHYTESGLGKTVTSLEFVGDGSWKVAKGIVVRVDGAGRTVVMKTADGEWTLRGTAVKSAAASRNSELMPVRASQEHSPMHR